MKKTIFVAMAMICAYATAIATGKIPTVVLKSFNQKFPKAAHVKWDKENEHEYEATFLLKGKKHSANYSNSGAWLETESESSFELLPMLVEQVFSAAHKGAALKAVAKIETSKGATEYEIEIKKGSKTVELFYDEDGNEINK